MTMTFQKKHFYVDGRVYVFASNHWHYCGDVKTTSCGRAPCETTYKEFVCNDRCVSETRMGCVKCSKDFLAMRNEEYDSFLDQYSNGGVCEKNIVQSIKHFPVEILQNITGWGGSLARMAHAELIYRETNIREEACRDMLEFISRKKLSETRDTDKA